MQICLSEEDYMAKTRTIDEIIRHRGNALCYASPSFLLQTKGMKSPRRKSVKNQSCRNCLWNWQDVHGGKGRVCYKNTSPRYHQAAGGMACVQFEYRVNESKGKVLYDND